MKDTYSYCREELNKKGLRITPQRLSIFCCLVNSKLHPSAETVYKIVRKQFPNISFDTVNRTMLSLFERGLINIVESGYGPRRYDADLKQHYHFRCLKCKNIIDFESPDYDNIKIPEDIKKKFKLCNQKIVLEGICPECLVKEKNKNKTVNLEENLNN